jgi:esterase/lipase
MVKLTKPKILTSSAFQTKAGKVKFTEKRYNLSNKVQGKEIRNTDELTNSVKKKITGMVKEKGAIIVSVAYWMDKIYSTNTIVLEKEDDIVKLKFDEFNWLKRQLRRIEQRE